MRASTASAIGFGVLFCLLVAGNASSAPVETSRAFHPSAIKGQTIELEVLAPPQATKMTFKMQQKEAMVDTEPPFRFSIPTADLRPAIYKWHSWAAGTGCCDGQASGGAIQIYPLPRVRAPKVSALVIAGTARLVGLVVSRVTPQSFVKAWSFPKHGDSNGLRELPLRLRQRHRAKKVYRFPSGFFVNVGQRTEIAVEVAPPEFTFRQGVEVRGRLAHIWLTRDRRSGATRAHRSEVIACTTTQGRKESFPGRQSCTTAPSSSKVSILCAKSVPCEPGTAPAVNRIRTDRAQVR